MTDNIFHVSLYIQDIYTQWKRIVNYINANTLYRVVFKEAKLPYIGYYSRKYFSFSPKIFSLACSSSPSGEITGEQGRQRSKCQHSVSADLTLITTALLAHIIALFAQ